MAGQGLNVNSVLLCPHGGRVQIISSNTRTKGGGGFLVTAEDTFTVIGCPYYPGYSSPCVTVRWLVTDTRVKVIGSRTLSQSSVGLCLNAAQAPQGTVTVVNTQANVKSM